MRRPLFFSLFLLSLLAGLMFSRLGRWRDVYRGICDLSEEHFYRDDEPFRQWLKRCHLRSAQISAFAGVNDLLGDVQSMMDEMGISHFQIYNPIEDRRMWQGQSSIDTGIRSRFVEDHLVVYKIYPSSPAAAAGVMAGDDILSIAGAEQLTPWGAQHRSGLFQFRRKGREISVNIHPGSFQIDSSPQIYRVGKTTAVLDLSSFRSEFFVNDAWKALAQKLNSYQRLIIDVRENAGGNFVAMLRALSVFRCSPSNIGVLEQPRQTEGGRTPFDDNTDDDLQLRELDANHTIELRTFAGYGCFSGEVTVLIGPETASVAEIFANSFLKQKKARVWGQPTSGDVVLAVWYDIPSLGPGYSVSIPEAVYLSPEGKALEGQGVWPERELYYDLKAALEGRDLWLEQALR